MVALLITGQIEILLLYVLNMNIQYQLIIDVDQYVLLLNLLTVFEQITHEFVVNILLLLSVFSAALVDKELLTPCCP